MSTSVIANRLFCKHCGKQHGTSRWPVNGDLTPLYFQSEPGNYTLDVTCPHCAKPWYVVWDVDPGPIETLEGVARHETLGQAMARTGATAEEVLRSWLTAARGGAQPADRFPAPADRVPAPAAGRAAKKCDICLRVQPPAEVGWRTAPHREVTASADLVSYAMALKLFGARPDDVVKASFPEPVRRAWIAQIEAMFGESDWLLCPECSRKIETKCDVCECKQTYPSDWRHKLNYKIDSGTTDAVWEAGSDQGLDALEERGTMTGHPVNWRTITHQQLKTSPVLVRKAVQGHRRTDEDVTSEMRETWIAKVERERGKADWLLCPDCSHCVGDFEERYVRVEQEAARGYRVAAEEAQADAELASGSARRSAAQAKRNASALVKQFEALQPSLGARAERSLASALASTGKAALADAKKATGEATDGAAQAKVSAAEAFSAASAAEGMYKATVEGELEKYRKDRTKALRKKAKELNIQIAAAAGKANAQANASIDAAQRAGQAAKQVERAAARLKLAVTYGLADCEGSPDEEPRFSEPPKSQLDLLVSALFGVAAIGVLGFLLSLGLGSGLLAGLTLLAALAAGGSAVWLNYFSPWRSREEEEKQRQIASQLPALLEQTMLRRLLDEDSPPPEPIRLAVRKIAELAKQGPAAAAELGSLLSFKGGSPTEEAYARWRATRALEQLGIRLPLDPMKVFQADLYLKTKTIAWRDEASLELARIVEAASKAIDSRPPQKHDAHPAPTPPRGGSPNQPAAADARGSHTPVVTRAGQRVERQSKSPDGGSAESEPAVRFSCPQCGKPITAPPGSRGKSARCPKCKTSLTIPASLPEQEHR